MERDDWDIISVADIANEFKIPFLADMIAYDKSVEVNMNHAKGWFEAEGENFLFMPVVEFHPMENKSGFKLLVFDVESDEPGMEHVSSYTFLKAVSETGYEVTLDEEGCILEERIKIRSDECEELESFPSSRAFGYNNDPFKTLGFDPTQ